MRTSSIILFTSMADIEQNYDKHGQLAHSTTSRDSIQFKFTNC